MARAVPSRRLSGANLAAARAARRAREVGLRKTLGASAARVLGQHLLEAALLVALAMAVALGIVAAAAPALERATGIDLRTGLFAVADSWPVLAAGAYPAFLLACVPAAAAVRTGRSRGGSAWLSAVLAGAQFAVATLGPRGAGARVAP